MEDLSSGLGDRGRYVTKAKAVSMIARWLKNTLAYSPRGKAHGWITSRSWITLLLLYLALTIALTCVFALIYQWNGQVWDSAIYPNGGYTTDFGRLCYYSIVTQTTLGFGDMTPRGSATIVTSLHVRLAVILHAIAFGFIVLKITNRKHYFQFANHVCYNPDEHQLNFWIWNRDVSGVHKVDCSIGVEKEPAKRDGSGIRQVRYWLKIVRNPTYVPSMMGMIIRTSSDTINAASAAAPPAAELDQTYNDITLATRDQDGNPLLENGKIAIEVRATVANTGAEVFTQRLYTFGDVICGEYADIADPSEPYPENWRYRQFENFGKVIESDSKRCENCRLADGCQLDPAVKYRADQAEIAT